MQSLRVRDKNQITLPMPLVKAAGLRPDDSLQVDYRDGVILLFTAKAKIAKRPSLFDFAGSTKGLYGKDATEINQYLADERATWGQA